MSRQGPSCVVVGAGPIGLYTAARLATVGCAVTLIDDGQRGAGWASGGMLGAVYETVSASDTPNSFKKYALESQWLWSRYLKASPQIPYVRGSVFVARTPEEALLFQNLPKQLETFGISNSSVEACALPEGVNGLQAWACPSEFAFDPRGMLLELRRECESKDVRFRTGSVVAVENNQAVLWDGSRLSADYLVITTGMPRTRDSSSDLCTSIPELANLTPVKGQMLAVASNDTQLNHVVRAGHIYVIPRGDRFVIGATSQTKDEDIVTFDRAAHSALWQEACTLMPALQRGQIVESWAGLRPKTPDGLPLLGFATNPCVILATGAYRNGWLLAAAMANSVMGLVLSGEETAKNLQPFAPNRFSKRV